jgi:RHS repeat-associated protein
MTVVYTYDNAGRQTGKTVKRSDNSVIASYSFTLDNSGNIISENRTEPYTDITLPAENVSYSYNNANRITQAGSTAFTFDANGNTKMRGDANYNYEALDKLISGGSFTFDYDGLGNIRSNGSKRYMINVSGIGNVIAETDMSGNPTAYYIYGTGLEARILPNNTTEYYVSDYRGSVVAMTDASTSANITHKYQYDEFGNVVQKEESDDNPFRYVGKYGVMYASDNLYYMRARFYDPTIGRFLSEDPIWSTNLYPYADNNPVMGIDPRGKSSDPIQEAMLLTVEKLILKRTSNATLEKGYLTEEQGIDIVAKQTFSTISKMAGIKNSEAGLYINMAYSVGKDIGKTGGVSLETGINITKDIMAEGAVVFLASVTGGSWYTNPYAKAAVKETLKTGGDFGEKYLTKAQDEYIFPFLDRTLGTILFPNK